MAERESDAARFHVEKEGTPLEGKAALHPEEPDKVHMKEDMVGGTLELKSSGSSSDEPDTYHDVHPDEPTEEEKHVLRKVSGPLPWSAFLVAVIELCERFTFYGTSGVFQNYIQNPYPFDSSGVPGALDKGQSEATGLNNYFQFWCYVTPIIGAIVADQYLGRYNAICLFAVIYISGLAILVGTSFPVAIEGGSAFAGWIVASLVIGLGTGGIKSNVSPLIAEQYTETRQKIKTLKSGERVIVDPAVTVQRIYMIFYMCINIGGLSPIATTYLEKDVGFWSAYLLPLCIFLVGLVVLVAGKSTYKTRPPQGSVMPYCFKALWIGLRSGCKMDAAKPSYQESNGRKYETPWNDLFIDEVKRALKACKVFAFYPIYWVTYSQMINNFISQAGTMNLHGIPNDLMQNIDPLALIIFIPILDRFIYPQLRKWGIPFRPITRITMGFLFGAIAMAYAAIVQHLIYSSAPCYSNFTDDCSSNNIHVAIQTPAYVFIALSEIFASITGLEYAFTKAPGSMKSFVMSIFLFMNAGGSILGIALSPLLVDPKLTWFYTGLAVSAFIAGILVWVCFRHYNATEESMNELEKETVQIRRASKIHGIGGNARVEEEHV